MAHGAHRRRSFAQCARRSRAFHGLRFSGRRRRFHPVISLPEKQPLPYEPRWSRRPGCYQLKSALAWHDIGDAPGHSIVRIRARVRARIARIVSAGRTRIARKLMDRLHAYCYFLEALLAVGRSQRSSGRAGSRRRSRGRFAAGNRTGFRALRRVRPTSPRASDRASLGAFCAGWSARACEEARPRGIVSSRVERSAPARRLLVWTKARSDAAVHESGFDGVLPASAGAVASAPVGHVALRAAPTDLSGLAVKVLFASGSEAVIARTLERLRRFFRNCRWWSYPSFAPPAGEWIPFHVKRGFRENRELVRSMLQGRKIRIAAAILGAAHALLAAAFSGLLDGAAVLHGVQRGRPAFHAAAAQRAFDRPASAVARGEFPALATQARRLDLHVLLALRASGRAAQANSLPAGAAQRAMAERRISRAAEPPPARRYRPAGISVVIPSRNGRELLAGCLPLITMPPRSSSSTTARPTGRVDYLREMYPEVVVEHCAGPLSFARAVNRGIRSSTLLACLRVEQRHVGRARVSSRASPGFRSGSGSVFRHRADFFSRGAASRGNRQDRDAIRARPHRFSGPLR